MQIPEEQSAARARAAQMSGSVLASFAQHGFVLGLDARFGAVAKNFVRLRAPVQARRAYHLRSQLVVRDRLIHEWLEVTVEDTLSRMLQLAG